MDSTAKLARDWLLEGIEEDVGWIQIRRPRHGPNDGRAGLGAIR
jgi:hypothetical protein